MIYITCITDISVVTSLYYNQFPPSRPHITYINIEYWDDLVGSEWKGQKRLQHLFKIGSTSSLIMKKQGKNVYMRYLNPKWNRVGKKGGAHQKALPVLGIALTTPLYAIWTTC